MKFDCQKCGLPRLLRRREHASALVMVLWISFGLVTMALYFGHSMSVELKTTTNVEAGVQSEQAIEGAARYLKYLFANLPSPGQLPEETLIQREGVPVGEAYFWLVGRDPETTDGTRPYFNLIDESGKLNLNIATLAQLQKLPNMSETFAAAIIDWRDSDDEASENGAESDVYLRNDPPYTAKNGPFESVEELRLVYGADEVLLYGEDLNGNGILDPNENDGDLSPPTDNQDGRLDRGLVDYLTVYSREPATQTNGEPRIAVVLPNNASAQQRQQVQTALRAHLTEMLSEERANEILGRVGNTIASVLDFYMRSGMSLDEFVKVDDALGMSTNVVQGLINVNTASVDVLATLQGLEINDAEALVAYRITNPTALQSVGWVTEVLEEAKARAIGPFITDKGFQYTADICAVGRGGRGFRRSRMVFDISEGRPKVVYRREMTQSGWALGADVRQQLVELVQQR